MSESNNPGFVGVPDVMGIVFVILKCVGVITWSWWWVLSPWWIALLLVLALHVLGE